MNMLAVREVQIPLLAVLLLGACAAKLGRTLRAGSVTAGLGPTALFPAWLRRPALITVCVAELGLGAALLLTAEAAGPAWRAPPDEIRVATAAFFLIAMCALVELHTRRPDAGCGCFGDLSTGPAGIRSILRAGVLALAALASIGVRPAGLPPPRAAALDAGILLVELALIAMLSPEAGEVLVRLGYSEPCELRVIPPTRTIAALRHSSQWRKQAGVRTAAEPADVWRELCWRYLVFPGRQDGRDAEVIYAVQMKMRRPAIRSVVTFPVTSDETEPGLVPLPEPATRDAVWVNLSHSSEDARLGHTPAERPQASGRLGAQEAPEVRDRERDEAAF